MRVPLHRSIDTKGALALSFGAFLMPVLFVLFVDAFLLPSPARSSQLAYYEDVPSALQQAVYNAPQPGLAARATPPKMGYMLGNPLLVARQQVNGPDDQPAADDEDQSTSTSSRTSSRTTSTATNRRPSTTSETTRRARPTATNRPRPTETAKKTKRVNACAWNREIQGTKTTPLWLTLGLSAGAIFGILISAFTAYQYGKASKGAGGGMGGAPPPPMY